MSSFDLITVGNAIIDTYLTLHDAHLPAGRQVPNVRLDEKTKELCFPSGAKIKVDKAEFLLGGNAANVAVGATRLGYVAAIAAEIGDDEFSEKIVNTFKKDHIDLSLLKRSHAGSSFAIGINFQGERTLFVEHVKRVHDFTFENTTSKWMYLTSIGQEWHTAYKNALGFVDSAHVHLAYNPGTYQLEMLGQEVFPILSRCDILFVNKEEAAAITQFKLPEGDDLKENEKIIVDLLQILSDHGVKTVVITDGKNGAYCHFEKTILHASQFPAEIVERTGAGDAFATGFLGAVMSGLDHKEAMKWGSVNAASVIEHIGAQEGLLGKEDIQKRLQAHPEFEVQTL